MRFSDNAMSAILLCSYIGVNQDDVLKPFSLGEWNVFLVRIIEKNLEPAVVLNEDLEILNGLNYDEKNIERIKKLVSRGGAAALELENLAGRGIEVITLFDTDYPVLLKRRLKRKTPPVLFYSGDINLAKKIGIAVVGSRNIEPEGIEFTKELVRKASEERLIIYSGGAKGVDTVSENTAIQNGGATVSFIAYSLSAKIKRKEILDHIIQGKLLLVSDVKPDAGFSAARAMNRNKYIYAAAYGAFVVASDYNKGGTWAGAVENLKNKWTKEFVWKHETYTGNLKLIEKGGIPYVIGGEKIYDLIKKQNDYSQINIFHLNEAVSEDSKEYGGLTDKSQKEVCNRDIYEVVKSFITENIGTGLNIDQAAEQFNIAKGQMKNWLRRLCDDGILICKKGIYLKKEE